MTRFVEDCKLTGRKAAPIMHRSFRVIRFLMIVREEPRVLYISAAIESQEETRTWFPKAHEYKKWTSSAGSSTCEGTGPFDGLARYRRHSRCSSVHLPVTSRCPGSTSPCQKPSRLRPSKDGVQPWDDRFAMSKPQGESSIFLRASRDIETVKRHGRRISTTLFNLLTYKIDDAPSRVGIIVGKRFGNAVRRNRAKRVFRALVRQRHQDLIPGQALLVFPKRDARVQTHEDLTRMWEASLRRVHLIRPKAD
jgi:ribonuclease P protein component